MLSPQDHVDARLPQQGAQQRGEDAGQGPQGDDDARPVEADSVKRDREGGVDVDLVIGLQQARGERGDG